MSVIRPTGGLAARSTGRAAGRRASGCRVPWSVLAQRVTSPWVPASADAGAGAAGAGSGGAARSSIATLAAAGDRALARYPGQDPGQPQAGQAVERVASWPSGGQGERGGEIRRRELVAPVGGERPACPAVALATAMVPAIAAGPTGLASPATVSSPPPSSASPAAVAVTRPGRRPSRWNAAAVGSMPCPPKVPKSFCAPCAAKTRRARPGWPAAPSPYAHRYRPLPSCHGGVQNPGKTASRSAQRQRPSPTSAFLINTEFLKGT